MFPISPFISLFVNKVAFESNGNMSKLNCSFKCSLLHIGKTSKGAALGTKDTEKNPHNTEH